MLKKFKSNFFKARGQTLIEAVVTLGVVVVIVGALVVLVIANGRRSNLSKQSDQATKIAQQGIELIRGIKQTTGSPNVYVGTKGSGAGTPCNSGCIFKDLYDRAQTSISACISTDGLNLLTPPLGCETTSILNLFTRSVTIEDGVAPCASDFAISKRVTVMVMWTSTIGPETRKVQTCLTNR